MEKQKEITINVTLQGKDADRVSSFLTRANVVTRMSIEHLAMLLLVGAIERGEKDFEKIEADYINDLVTNRVRFLCEVAQPLPSKSQRKKLSKKNPPSEKTADAITATA